MMSKAAKPQPQEAENKTSTETGEFKTKVLAKSDWPKTPWETCKFLLSTILNFLP